MKGHREKGIDLKSNEAYYPVEKRIITSNNQAYGQNAAVVHLLVVLNVYEITLAVLQVHIHVILQGFLAACSAYIA